MHLLATKLYSNISIQRNILIFSFLYSHRPFIAFSAYQPVNFYPAVQLIVKSILCNTLSLAHSLRNNKTECIAINGITKKYTRPPLHFMHTFRCQYFFSFTPTFLLKLQNNKIRCSCIYSVMMGKQTFFLLLDFYVNFFLR